MEKILVVDDESGIQQLCRRVLESPELEVYTADDGEKALLLVNEEKFDLLLTDLKMPGMSGIELLKRVKQLNPQTAVILITGQATIETAIDALKNGAYDYLLKPFDLSELNSSVQKCLEHHRLRRQESILSEVLYLYRFTQEIDKVRTEKELLDFILERAVRALGADTGILFLHAPDDGTLRAVSAQGAGNHGDDMQLGVVVRDRRPLLIQGTHGKLPQAADLPPCAEIASSVLAPIMDRDLLLGVIRLNRLTRQCNVQFTPHDLESLQIVTLHAAFVLTSLRHMKEQRELDELKSEFVSNVSHEVRTPLMAISGAVELLNNHDNPFLQDPKVRAYIDVIARNTGRMRSLVDDLLDFSRLETGMFKLNVSGVNLRTLFNEVIPDLEPRAREKNVALQVDLPEGENEIIADREKLKQVLVNLIVNALKFTPAGGWIKTGYRFDVGGRAVITVADSGIGIPRDKQGKVFEKFYQVDGSVSREIGGFGLGLAIVKSIVERHNGTIGLVSEEGKGSLFTVTIPCAAPHEGGRG